MAERSETWRLARWRRTLKDGDRVAVVTGVRRSGCHFWIFGTVGYRPRHKQQIAFIPDPLAYPETCRRTVWLNQLWPEGVARAEDAERRLEGTPGA